MGGIIANSLTGRTSSSATSDPERHRESFRHGVSALFLGAPASTAGGPQPMKGKRPAHLPAGIHQRTYAIAKIAGLKMCESFNLQYGTNYIAVMPTNLYGPNDIST
ncbi:MAG: NAD-dependent epimerase/dehydratase family protein [Akkermansia sp.]